MTTYTVRVFRTGHMRGLPGPEVYWMSDWDEKYPADFLAVLAQGGGRTAVINTGPPADMLDEMNEDWRRFRGDDTVMHVGRDEHVIDQLRAAGVAPESVDFVIATPFQNYATGNLDLFPNAQICLSRRGWVELLAPRSRPHPHDVPRYCFPPRILAWLVTEAWDRVRLLDDEEVLLPGLETFWVGCHHRSSIAVKIQTSKGAVIATDTCFKYGNVERPHPLGISENLYECLAAYERIKREAAIVLPLYDPEVFVRHPGGAVA